MSAVPVTVAESDDLVAEVKRSSALVLQRPSMEDEDEVSSSTSGIGTR